MIWCIVARVNGSRQAVRTVEKCGKALTCAVFLEPIIIELNLYSIWSVPAILTMILCITLHSCSLWSSTTRERWIHHAEGHIRGTGDISL